MELKTPKHGVQEEKQKILVRSLSTKHLRVSVSVCLSCLQQSRADADDLMLFSILIILLVLKTSKGHFFCSHFADFRLFYAFFRALKQEFVFLPKRKVFRQNVGNFALLTFHSSTATFQNK